MKLHLSAEDVALTLQDQAGRAAQRVPLAVKELLQIRVTNDRYLCLYRDCLQ